MNKAVKKSNLKLGLGIATAIGGFLAFPFFFVDFKLRQPHRPNPLAAAGVHSVRVELYETEEKNNSDNPFRNFRNQQTPDASPADPESK